VITYNQGKIKMDVKQNFVGNGTAPDAAQGHNDDSADTQVNPGAIRKSTTQSILNALSNASGQSFESVEAALAFIARTSASTPGGSVQPMESPKPQQQQGRVTTNDLHEQFTRLQQDLNRKEQALREKELDSEIMRAMGDRFDNDLLDYAMSKVKSNIQWNDDGTYVIRDSKGRDRYGLDGNPLSIQGLVQEVATGNPKLLKQSNLNSGSGLRPGQGNFAGAPIDLIPDYSKDPAAFNAWAQRNGLGKNIGLKGMTVQATVSNTSRKIL
jgi:hypothetical protein